MSLVLLEQVIAMLVMFSMTGQVQLATVFGSSRWDRGNPNSRLACYRARRINDAKDLLVAHNHLPCHTKVLLYNPRTEKAVVSKVGDRGPRHADIDLSKLTSAAIDHNGREDVLMIVLGPGEPEPEPAAAAKPSRQHGKHQKKKHVSHRRHHR